MANFLSGKAFNPFSKLRRELSAFEKESCLAECSFLQGMLQNGYKLGSLLHEEYVSCLTMLMTPVC